MAWLTQGRYFGFLNVKIEKMLLLKEIDSMGNVWVALRFLLMAVTIAAYLSACGDSSSSSTASSTAKTATWTNVSVRGLDGKVNINWDKATGSTLGAAQFSYNIYCSNSPTGIKQDINRIATNYSGTSFDHTNVTNGQRYYYAITEVSASGESQASRVVSATPDATLPAAPYGLKVTGLDKAAKVEFIGPTPPNSAIVSYNLYRSNARNNFTASSVIASKISFASPYIDPNLTNGTMVYYAVTAVVSGKESQLSPVVSVRPQAVVAPVSYSLTLNKLAAYGSPTDISAEPGNGSCIIRWSDAANPATFDQAPPISSTPDYILYWSSASDVSPDSYDGHLDSLSRDASSGGFKLTNLSNGTTYYLLIVAAVKDIDGKPITGRFTSGSVVSVTPAPKTPGIPNGVSATQGPQQVALTWNKDTSGISGTTYNIYVSTTDARTPAELMAKGIKKNNDDPTKAYYTHTGLQSGTTYYYVVTSVGGLGEGESNPSTIVAVTL